MHGGSSSHCRIFSGEKKCCGTLEEQIPVPKRIVDISCAVVFRTYIRAKVMVRASFLESVMKSKNDERQVICIRKSSCARPL